MAISEVRSNHKTIKASSDTLLIVKSRETLKPSALWCHTTKGYILEYYPTSIRQVPCHHFITSLLQTDTKFAQHTWLSDQFSSLSRIKKSSFTLNSTLTVSYRGLLLESFSSVSGLLWTIVRYKGKKSLLDTNTLQLRNQKTTNVVVLLATEWWKLLGVFSSPGVF